MVKKRYAVFRMKDANNFPDRSNHDIFMESFEGMMQGQAYSIKMNKKYWNERFYVRKLEDDELKKFNSNKGTLLWKQEQ